MDLNATITTIQETAKQAAGVKTTPLFDGRKLLLEQNGERQILDALPAIRRHTVTRLNDILNAVERYAKAGGTIWHNTEAVVLLNSDAANLDRVTLPLNYCEQFKSVWAIKAGVAMDQKTLVHWLRHAMHGTGVETLIPIFRKIEFDRSGRSGGNLKHGDESFGRSIEEKVVNAVDVPEGFTVEIPCFDIADLKRTYHVDLTVDIDIQQEKFILTPLPDQITRAVQQAEDDIHDYLRAELEKIEDLGSVQVFYGAP